MTPEALIALYCQRRGISAHRLRSNPSRRYISRYRHEAQWLLRKFTDASLEAIGDLTGAKNHTSVMYGIERTWERCEAKPEYRDELETLVRTRSAFVEALERGAA